ncbi:hypothetical protein EJB05_50064, partial [Eragrostis curvula]
MDAGDATALGSWATVRGYFTPTTLFLVLNLVIGTIALTSRSHQRRRREHLHDDAHNHHHHYQPPPLDPHHQQDYNYYQPQPQYATPAPLARTSSVLDRLRSIGLYRFRSGDFPPEYGAAPAVANHDVFAPVEEELTTKQASWSDPAPAREVEKKRAPPRAKKPAAAAEVRKAQVARSPARSRVVEAVAADVVDARAERFITTTSLRQPEPASPPKAEYHYQAEEEEEYVPPPAPMRAPPPLSRTSSVLERLRSISLYSFLGAADQPAAATDAFMATPADDKKPAHPTHYDRSRSEPAREQATKKKQLAAEAKMAKSSSSAARKPAAAPKLAEEECVDARAEAFIDSFRREQSQKQLHRHDADEEEEHAVVPPPAPLARTSSVLDRLRSFSLYLRSSDAVPEDPVGKKASSAAAADEKQQQQAQYARSRSEPAAKKKQGAAAAAKMSKTSSVVAAPVEECVDARADDFINKFRQQLQLQRLNSLLGGAKQ